MKPKYQKSLPKNADFTFTAEWWFSPVSTRIDTFFIAKDKSKKFWVLWLTWFDDNWLENKERIIDCMLINNSENVKHTAFQIIKKFWIGEKISGFLSFGPEFISQIGILNEDDIEILIKEVWG
tara:strand:- start:515 stop:883 length:369 start_codon:yes stop_codon:yes gene_type:complete